MPVPPSLLPHTEDPAFWTALLTPGVVSAEARITLPVAGGWGLVLDLAGGEQALGVRHPHAHEPEQLGWAAADRPHPAVLHAADLDVIGRVIALDDPALPHPGLTVALLSGFAPPADALSRATAEAAYRSLRRPVPPVAGPEQVPLPLFADPRWWPRPLSDRVVGEGDIAAWLSRGAVAVRAHAGVTELVRQARRRLARLPGQPWCDATTVLPPARRLVATGDVGPAGELLAVLAAGGCDHPTVLDAFTDPVVPAQACWVAEALTGAEPGTALRRYLHASERPARPLG
jgi:hypothetical protein